jgi:hypothetical protein
MYMEDQMKKQLQEFFTICYARLNQQKEPRGEQFRNLDLYEEMAQELADVANYAFLEYLKITELKEKKEDSKAPANCFERVG